MKNNVIVVYHGLACLANLVVFAFLVVEVVTRYPHNHTGIDPWLFAIILVPTIGALAAPWLLKSNWKWAVCGSWITLLVSFVAIDVFTILVEYEKWGDRGLAEWGTPIWTIAHRQH